MYLLTNYAIFLAKTILWDEYGLTLEDVGVDVYHTDKGEIVNDLSLEKVLNRILYYWNGFEWIKLDEPILKAD